MSDDDEEVFVAVSNTIAKSADKILFNNSNIEERKKEIKRQCLKMGIDYNKPWKPPLVAIGTTSDN